MFTKVNSCAAIGLNCELVEVESDKTTRQLPAFIIVGLTDTAIQEARERVRLAIENSGFQFPRGKVIVNLAPADLKKEGPAYDLAVAVSILQGMEPFKVDISDSLFVGELALGGELRKTTGILPMAIFAKERGLKKIFVPEENKKEAALIKEVEVYPVRNLVEIIDHLQGERLIAPFVLTETAPVAEEEYSVDMKDIVGQEQAKRALEIAAAGGHNVLFNGPPGSGKTLLARALPTILPELSEDEILEVTKIYSVAGLLPKEKPMITTRPFRSPHHSSSGVALVGGGKFPRPGEISLAHRGILFLDEFPEFPRPVLETLRQPLEDGIITISRAQGTVSFPARFTLVASQNPCPCGYYSDPEKRCTCTTGQVLKYNKKISGPIIDRIDLHVEVPRLNFEKINNGEERESSRQIRERVLGAIEKQRKRFQFLNIKYNSEMRPAEVKVFCELDTESMNLLRNAIDRFHLSMRSYHRILKVARTIADLGDSEVIQTKHLAEALQYRARN